MAIDNVRKLTILTPLGIREQLLAKLYKMQIVHVVDAFSKKHEKDIKRIIEAVDDSHDKIHCLNIIKSIFDLFDKRKRSMFESFFPIPLLVKQSEFNHIIHSFDRETLYRECREIKDEYHALDIKISNTETELNNSSVFLELPYDIQKRKEIKMVETEICHLSHNKLREMSDDHDANEILTWQIISSVGKRTNILIFYLKKEADKVSKIIEKFDLSGIPFPETDVDIKKRFDSLNNELQQLSERKTELKNRVTALSKQYRNDVEIMLSYWESERERRNTERNLASSGRIVVISGYIRESDIISLENALNNLFPECSCVYEDPDPKDKVPVSITLNNFFKPVQLLTNMFGLPNYFNFDPTPFLTVGFLLFFGICFGDVLYGLMLITFSYYTMRKYAQYEDIKNFFKLFVYAGISTTIIGAIVGGWAGDIYNADYLGEDNLILRLRNLFIIIDPLARPIIALVFAISLGIINQFFGISLRMYGELRKGNVGNAVCDGILWLIFLPGILIITIPLFIKIPGWLINTGLYITMGSAIGLALTQGRNEKNWAGRIITGIVSMYGILGTYGCATFISDILSYSRLMAIGLTTTIIAMSFNILANIVKSWGIIGIFGFVIILIFGHTFNFLICIVGSFVHPARLIFLEFFGRFYEGSGVKFQPYGFRSKRIQLLCEE